MRRIAAAILACLIARQTPSSTAVHAHCDPLGLRSGDGARHSSTSTFHTASSSSGWRRTGAAGGARTNARATDCEDRVMDGPLTRARGCERMGNCLLARGSVRSASEGRGNDLQDCTRGRLTLRGGADASGGGVGEEMAFVEEIGDNSTLRVEVLLMLERTTRPPDSSLDRLEKKKRCTTGHAAARIFPLSVHPGGYPGANLGSISNRCHPILVAFAWELREETINLPLDCLQGGESRSECLHPVIYSSLIVCISSIVVSIRSRSSFISSPVWTP